MRRILSFTPCLLLSAGWLTVLSTAAQAEPPPPQYPEHFDLSYRLDADGQRQPIKTPADWDLRRRHILAHLQEVMGPLPAPAEKVPLGMQMLAKTKIGDIVRRKISFHSDSATDVVPAYLFIPPGAGKRPAVLCLQQTTQIGKAEPAGEGGNADLQYALHLAQRGYVTLAPDYPSFGDYKYDFAPSRGYVSGTMKAIYDNIRAVDLLQSLPEVDGERIGVIGHSLGGHNAMFTAAFEPRLKAIVSSCGFCSFQKDDVPSWTGPRYMPLIATKFGNDPKRVPFDFPEIVASFAPRAFFASACTQDGDFDVTGVQDCIKSAEPVYRLLGAEKNLQAIYPEAGHSFPAEARKAAYDFLDRQLKAAP